MSSDNLVQNSHFFRPQRCLGWYINDTWLMNKVDFSKGHRMFIVLLGEFCWVPLSSIRFCWIVLIPNYIPSSMEKLIIPASQLVSWEHTLYGGHNFEVMPMWYMRQYLILKYHLVDCSLYKLKANSFTFIFLQSDRCIELESLV